MQDFATDRIEEGLGQFRLLVVRQQADVVQLDFAPHRVGQVARLVLVFQNRDAFLHPLVVKADPFARRQLRHLPLAVFKMPLGGLAGGTKQPVVLVEAVQDRARNIERDLRGQQFGEGDLRHGGIRQVIGFSKLVV